MSSKIIMEKDKEYMEWWDSLAFDYESKVLSPLYEGVKNPVFGFVKALNSKECRRVADLGCGRGELLDFLSQHFEEVWGFDWSKNMLRIAKQKLKNKKNVHLKKLDIRNLRPFHGQFDIVFSVNTIAPYDISLAEAMVKEVYRAIRANGIFVGIFPSFDTVLYQRELTHADYVKRGLQSKDAWEKTDDYFIKRKKLDLEKGMYAEDGVHLQKFFTVSEIRSLLKDAGFSNIAMEKVLYPWELSREYGYGYFPGKPEIWDWFYVAYK